MSIVDKLYKEIMEADLNNVRYFTVDAKGDKRVITSSRPRGLVVRVGDDMLLFSRNHGSWHMDDTHRGLNMRLRSDVKFMEFFSSTVRVLSL